MKINVKKELDPRTVLGIVFIFITEISSLSKLQIAFSDGSNVL